MRLDVVVEPEHARRVWDAGENAWFLYAREVLEHLTVGYTTVPAASLPGSGRVLLLPAVPPLTDSRVRALERWVRDGGGLILCGDPGPLSALAGVRVTGAVAEAHVEVRRADPWGEPPDVELHAFGGAQLDRTDDGTEVLATWVHSGRAVITNRRLGAGQVTVFGADLWQSIVRIHQGWPVSGDDVPPADGTAPVDDAILKCDDGLALSYDHDRAMAPGAGTFGQPFRYAQPVTAPAPMFHRPHADLWRGLFASVLFWTAEQVAEPHAWLSYWPHGVPAVAHMSHDSDGNTDASADAALEAFGAANVPVTWCFLHPGGYSPRIYKEVAEAGHEIALHYNAMGESELARWGFEYLEAQLRWAIDTTGADRIVSNKNHYTRWEGWHEFYLWCERLGIEIDQSRGPSKQGNVGFPFGTCQVTFPIADRAEGNRRIDVLSLPMQAQDLWYTCAVENREVFLEQALRHHGVAHFLFHGRNIVVHPEVRQAVVDTADAARRRGMPWWTSERINDWVRRRRQVRLTAEQVEGGLVVSASSAVPVAGADVLLSASRSYRRHGEPLETTVRHGRCFQVLPIDIPAGESTWILTND